MSDLFTVMTFNVWGAPYAKHREARMYAIGEKIQALSPDIVLCQEVFLLENRRILMDSLRRSGYIHQHYFASGMLGSGLLTASRYPIIDVAFCRFRMGGKPFDFQHGDYYAGKGIGLTRIQTPVSVIDIYNCHPHAQYVESPGNEYEVYTNSNLYEAIKFIEAYSADKPIIFAGDMNVRPDQSGYKLITDLGTFNDAYAQLHADEGYTFAKDNPYVQSNNQRLDYIFVRNGLIAQRVDITMKDS